MTGRRLGNYLLLDEIGRGGMGTVYRARDARLDRTVAVKFLTNTRLNEDARRRFLLEAKAVSALNDAGIVTLYDIGTDGDVDYLVMEYVEGQTLGALLPSNGMEAVVALGYAEKIAKALAAAHANGIVHRDLKPGNVMVKPTGELKVLDFGLAKWTVKEERSDETETAMTGLGVALGTPSYMSPEQAMGGAVDGRSDIFALGVVLYELLAGRRPFSGNNTVALVHAINYEEPLAIVPAPPRAAREVLRRALEKKPEKRYPTMDEFAADLRMAIAELDPKRGPVWRMRLPVREWRRKAAVVALVVLGVLVWVYGGRMARGGRGEGARPAHEMVTEARRLMTRADVAANVEKATRILREAVENHDQHAAAHANLALVLLKANAGNPGEAELGEAEEHARRAVELDGQLAVAHVAVGSYAYAAGQQEEAERELTGAVRLDPGNEPAHLALGVLYFRKRRFEQAEQEYQAAVRLQPDDFEARYGLAAVYYTRGNYAAAEAESREAVRLAPDSPQPHQMLGSIHYALGRLEEAVREFQKALEIQPSPRVYSNLGTVYFFREMYREAAAAFERATKLQPERYLYWGNLGDAYRWTEKEKGKAAAAYGKAIALARGELQRAPGDMETRSRLAMMLSKAGDVRGAREELERVERSNGEKTGQLYYRLAITNEVIGAREKALRALEKAVKANYPLDEIRRDPELLALRRDERFARIGK